MKYLSVSEARDLKGLRLVLSAGLPGPWGEAAKGVLHVRNIPFVPVAQLPLQANDELIEWTGIRNAPIAVYNDELPISGWLDILFLAERIGSGPSLLPDDYSERALALGLTSEIGSPGGLGWNRRYQIFADMPEENTSGAYGKVEAPVRREMTRDYRVSKEAITAAPARIVQILDGLTAQLRRQKQAGSDYLVGQRLSVADIYWAAFSNAVAPLPRELNPMSEKIRQLYSDVGPVVANSVSDELMVHRQMIFERHLVLPLDF